METATSAPHDDNNPPCDEQQRGSDDTAMRATPQSTIDEDGNEKETIPPREATSFTGIAVPNALSSADPTLDNKVVTSDAQTSPLTSPKAVPSGAQTSPLSSHKVVPSDAQTYPLSSHKARTLHQKRIARCSLMSTSTRTLTSCNSISALAETSMHELQFLMLN